MQTHRAIYRLDYPFSDTMCDAPGKVIRTIMDVGGDRYSEVQDSPLKRIASVEGSSDDDAVRWKLQVAPLFIVLSMEWAHGSSLGELTQSREFKDALEVVDGLKQAFSIDQILRAGLRSFHFEEIPGINTLECFKNHLNDALTDKVVSIFGDVKDLALIYEGQGVDSIFYRLSLGPYFEHEHAKYLEMIKAAQAFGSYNFVCDSDLSQKSFRSKGHTSSAWVKSLLPRMKKFEREIGESLRRPV